MLNSRSAGDSSLLSGCRASKIWMYTIDSSWAHHTAGSAQAFPNAPHHPARNRAAWRRLVRLVPRISRLRYSEKASRRCTATWDRFSNPSKTARYVDCSLSSTITSSANSSSVIGAWRAAPADDPVWQRGTSDCDRSARQAGRDRSTVHAPPAIPARRVYAGLPNAPRHCAP